MINSSDRGFYFRNPHQIINMGGPWIGDLYKDEAEISDNVIIDNIVLGGDNKIFFIKYHRESKWLKDNFFTLNYYDIDTETKYQSIKKFDMLYIGELIDHDTIELYNAFHGLSPEKLSRFSLHS